MCVIIYVEDKKSMYEKLVETLKTFLENYNRDLSDIKFNELAGYTKHDAIFDEIFFEDFSIYLKDNGLWDLMLEFDNDMDSDVESEEYDRATETWNVMCDMVEKKVEAYL